MFQSLGPYNFKQKITNAREKREILFSYSGRTSFEGEKDGRGMLVDEIEDLYEGHFKNGKFHGPGRLIKKRDNYVMEGNFKDGKAHGYCSHSTSDTNYKGYF